MNTNSAILLTPPGAAAIAVVRIFGAKTHEFLERHFSGTLRAGKAAHGVIADGAAVLDDPLVVLHDDGLTADLSIHGGPWVVKAVLDLAERNGFTVVATVPPPQVQEGNNPIEKRMLALLPLAKTELALRWVLAQPGAWHRKAGRLAVADLTPLLYPPRVAIVGDANVGKSTLANQLFAQERSITADRPGTTRDWVGEIADLDGLAVFLMDTPGMRQSGDAIERAAIEGGKNQVAQADLIVLVVDATTPLSEQHAWADRYPAALLVRNKCDQAKEIAPLDAARPHVHTVATTGIGIDQLRSAIRRRFIRGWRHPRRGVSRDPSTA